MTHRSDAGTRHLSRRLHQLRPAATGNEVRVLLCEDQEIFRLGLRVLIDGESDLEVVGEADSISAACALNDRVDAQVIVVAQGLLPHGDDGPLHQLSDPGGAVLVLAESDSEFELVRALRAGARGYLSRQIAALRLLEGIRALARDEPALDPSVARQLMRHLMDGPASPSPEGPMTPLNQLTERQRAVALLVAEGLTNEQIAAQLYVSLATVKSHLTAALRRLDIRSRTQLAILINRDETLPA